VVGGMIADKARRVQFGSMAQIHGCGRGFCEMPWFLVFSTMFALLALPKNFATDFHELAPITR
ncbi:MAG: hypothetical protein UZ12_BCD005001441, partial [Bacteroidetes bacterium OLB12]